MTAATGSTSRWEQSPLVKYGMQLACQVALSVAIPMIYGRRKSILSRCDASDPFVDLLRSMPIPVMLHCPPSPKRHVPFGGIARKTGGHAVFRNREPASRFWLDVINCSGMTAAICAAIMPSVEYRSAKSLFCDLFADQFDAIDLVHHGASPGSAIG